MSNLFLATEPQDTGTALTKGFIHSRANTGFLKHPSTCTQLPCDTKLVLSEFYFMSIPLSWDRRMNYRLTYCPLSATQSKARQQFNVLWFWTHLVHMITTLLCRLSEKNTGLCWICLLSKFLFPFVEVTTLQRAEYQRCQEEYFFYVAVAGSKSCSWKQELIHRTGSHTFDW